MQDQIQLQKRAASIILDKDFSARTTELFLELKECLFKKELSFRDQSKYSNV